MSALQVAWVGLGSNEGDARSQVLRAAARLAAHPDLHEFTLSPLYRTQPWGVTDQPDFVNAVARCRTALAPLEMLDLLLDLEGQLGRDRERGRRWGPRRIDLDLLMFDNVECVTQRLTLPHPHMHERAFVLAPMLDLDAALTIPGRGRVSDCLEAVSRNGVTLIGKAGPLKPGAS